MANGVVISSEGVWHGTIDWGGKKVCGQFEVFPSEGAWSFLLGKLLLKQFGAIHRYDTDTMLLCVGMHYVELHSKAAISKAVKEELEKERQVTVPAQAVTELGNPPTEQITAETPKCRVTQVEYIAGCRRWRGHQRQGPTTLTKHGETMNITILKSDDSI